MVNLIHVAATPAISIAQELKVASTGMETQDAHEDILVIGQVGDSLDILNMGMPQKTQAK